MQAVLFAHRHTPITIPVELLPAEVTSVVVNIIPPRSTVEIQADEADWRQKFTAEQKEVRVFFGLPMPRPSFWQRLRALFSR